METTQTITTFAEAEERLAESLPGYESRPQQQALAVAIEESLATGKHLIAQAGCGTGKSLGYLIPSILSGQRVVIATATKALQDQIAQKDLPFLEEHLGVPFSWAVVKGRSNYACLAELSNDDADSVEGIATIREVAVEIREELADAARKLDRVGERDDFPAMSNIDWNKITTSSEECPGKSNCPFGESCFSYAAKQRAQEAQVVIVNHAMLFTELMVRELSGEAVTLIGDFDAVVFDEAHEAEDYAVSMLGTSISEGTVYALTSQVRNFGRKVGDERAIAACGTLLGATEGLWSALPFARVRAATVLDHETEWENFLTAASGLCEAISKTSLELVPEPQIAKLTAKKATLLKRARNLFQRVADLVVDVADTTTRDNLVSWVEEETTRKGEKRKIIKSAPVNVAPILSEWLFSKTPTILVSATILVDGKADYISSRLGVTDFDTIDVGTPFDFESQCRLYIPTNIPEPSPKNREQWEMIAIEETKELVMASQGRALLLFTSVKQMKKAFDALEPRLPFECRKQGDAPNKELGEWFKANNDSVLFATRSFFTGVDFSGDTCSLVVVDKLPFAVPTDPMVEARCEAIEAQGGNSFSDFTVPSLSLVIQQAHGRAIRHRNDKAVVAILDPRLKTKPYGKTIMRSLPSSPAAATIGEVAAFLN